MKSRAFTMIELLGVIALMAILIAIAVPSVLTISERMRTDMYCEKVAFVENGAQLWGQDNYDMIFNTEGDSVEISVSDLVKTNYLNADGTEKITRDSDTNVETRTCNGDEASSGETVGSKCIANPQDNSSLNDRKVLVFIKNTRIYANYIFTQDEIDQGICVEEREEDSQ